MVEKSLITNGIDEYARTARTRLVPIGDADKERYFSIINAALSERNESLTDKQRAEIWRLAASNDAVTFMVWDNSTGDCIGYSTNASKVYAVIEVAAATADFSMEFCDQGGPLPVYSSFGP